MRKEFETLRDDAADNPYFDQQAEAAKQKLVKPSKRYENGSNSSSSQPLDIFVDIKKQSNKAISKNKVR